MEKKIQLQTPDNHIIYGTLNWNEPGSTKLIVFVHGLTWDQNRHIFHNSAKFFPQHWFATFRFNLYDYRENWRYLKNCSLETHWLDIDTVVDHFSNQFSEIFLVGHSLWWPSILYSSQNVQKIVLRDPSLIVKKEDQKDWIYNTDDRMYHMEQSSVDVRISKSMYEQRWNTSNAIKHMMKAPTKIICAWEGVLSDSWKSVLDTIPVPYEFFVIEWAWHSFDEEGTEEQLFQETLRYLVEE